MVSIDPIAGSLAVTFIHSVLYGGYLILLAISLWVLVFRRGKSSKGDPRSINRALLASTVVLSLLITTNWVLEIISSFRLFIHQDFSTLGLLNYNRIATTAVILTEVVVADLTMVYRLYTVWGRSWRVTVAPLITTAVTIATGTKSIVDMGLNNDATAYYNTTRPEVLTLCVSELATNIIVTGLIAYRIWSIDRGTRRFAPSLTVMPLLSIIIESASIFTTLLIIILATYLIDDAKLSGWALQVSSPSIGIAFCLIIVRCGLGLGIEERDRQQKNLFSSSRFLASGQASNSRPYPVSPNSSTVFSRDSRIGPMVQVEYFRGHYPSPGMLTPAMTSLPSLGEISHPESANAVIGKAF
ncbi:hypothetical protein HGRIS_000105 [Hohenbuehelia grisea]|uniref:Uncharacterized protein n=1 Tax=Hohenbuehelia grisea TaxID=104357 RepID=A0ABR3JQP2_9AGAR